MDTGLVWSVESEHLCVELFHPHDNLKCRSFCCPALQMRKLRLRRVNRVMTVKAKDICPQRLHPDNQTAAAPLLCPASRV